MRLGVALLVMATVFGVSGTVRAERRAPSRSVTPVVAVTLLDGWRDRSASTNLRSDVQTQRRESAEPGEDLTVVVERMWSQVRAYRRPGGAEFIVRGRF